MEYRRGDMTMDASRYQASMRQAIKKSFFSGKGWPKEKCELIAIKAPTNEHPSLTDPVASTFLLSSVSEKTSSGRQISQQAATSCQVAILPFSNINK